jgi:hypothetical protein
VPLTSTRSAFLRPGHFEGGERAGRQAAAEQRGVVDGDLAQHAGPLPRHRPPGHEGLGLRRDMGQPLAREVLRQVHGVRAEVAQRAGPGLVTAQPPGEREVRVHQPVLEVADAYVPQRSDPATGDHVAGEREGRGAAVVEADHGDLAAGTGVRGRTGHGLGLGDGVGQRLLAQHVLARLEGGDGDLGVAGAGGADVDELDVVPGDQRPPVGLGGRPAQPSGGRPHGRRVTSAHRRHRGDQRQVEDPADGTPALGVRGTHEGVADHAHAERGNGRVLRGGRLLWCG